MDKFSKKEIKELIIIFSLGTFVRESILGEDGDWKAIRDLEEKFFQYLKNTSFKDFFQDYKGACLAKDSILKDVEKQIEDYNEEEFWDTLMVLFGKRDFLRDITKEEKEEMKDTFWLPERVHDFYEKYSKEFEEHGINRLVIKE